MAFFEQIAVAVFLLTTTVAHVFLSLTVHLPLARKRGTCLSARPHTCVVDKCVVVSPEGSVGVDVEPKVCEVQVSPGALAVLALL